MMSDAELNKVLDQRYFKDHSNDFIESIISKAAKLQQDKADEFSTILRNIIIPEPRLTLTLCLAASFLTGIFSNLTLESNLFNEISELMYYGGELL